jgi:hypothetical protein
MIQHVEDCGHPLSGVDIAALEERLGILLPHDYKMFLMKYNGGLPVPRAFPIEGLKNNPFGVIQEFLGIDCSLETSNLDWNYKVMKGRLPANLFPIACDDGGDLICLSISGPDAGSVVFWDCHTEPPVPSYENVYRIASSFGRFLDSMQELPETD